MGLSRFSALGMAPTFAMGMVTKPLLSLGEKWFVGYWAKIDVCCLCTCKVCIVCCVVYPICVFSVLFCLPSCSLYISTMGTEKIYACVAV